MYQVLIEININILFFQIFQILFETWKGWYFRTIIRRKYNLPLTVVSIFISLSSIWSPQKFAYTTGYS